MYLKELEIFGFKSFPEKTSLKFEPGITVVVGPNGCGKSNILDAVKWALGEQSPKILRGSKMEDVIFNGTESHPPLNYSEVILNFSNEDGYFPINYREVSVARRLYRSGESHYFINKNIVRLKDIEELFMGTGIGESTYSFVEQGKIEAFLQHKPEEKRLIFDEASGIVKYKEKKREALRRLDDTEENLLRLEDIIIEVKRQIRYLERQVDKANKYKELENGLVGIEKKIAALQIHNLKTTSNKLLEELSLLKEEEEKKESQSQQANKALEEVNIKLSSLSRHYEETSTAIVSLNAQAENFTVQAEVCEQRIKELEERDRNADAAKASLSERLNLLDKRAKEEEEQLDAFENRAKDISEAIINLKSRKDNSTKDIEEAEKKIKEDKAAILELESQLINSRNSLIEIQTTLSSFIKRRQRLLLDEAKIERLWEESRSNYQTVVSDCELAEQSLNQLKKVKGSLSSQEKEIALKKEDLKNSLIEKEKEEVERRSYYDFLKDLRIKYETFSLKRKVTIIFDEEPKNINKLVASLKEAEFRKEGNFYKVSVEAKIISLEEEQLEEGTRLLQKEMQDAKREIDRLEKEEEDVSKRISIEISRIEEEQVGCQEKLQKKENLAREEKRFKEERQLLKKEIGDITQQISELEAKQKERESSASVCEENLNQAQNRLRDCQQITVGGFEEIKGIDIEIAKRQEQHQSLYKEKELLASKANLLEEERARILKNREEIDAEKRENDARRGHLKEDIDKLKTQAQESKDKIDECTKEKERLDGKRISLSEEIDKKKRFIQSLEKERGEIKAAVYNKKLEIQGIEYDREKIKDYLRQVYHIEFDGLPKEEIEEYQRGDEPNILDNLLEEKEKLKKKKESMGEVNLIALEEFEELKKRKGFLESQKSDLVTSKENLKKAIQKINRTSRELFLEVFSKIEKEFKDNFRFLFGGGRVELILLDKENILDSGVEIEVQPPGKKLQNVSLLSGGEKALTAIALIFSIFKVKPSPLCVLDEIDAPLDEANVDRFNHLLKEFSQNSQFILITHNKKTMSNASCLYGVTMQEKGVSKLVSVKFAPQEAPS